jgi:hypothetical protein
MSETQTPFTHPDIIPEPPAALFGGGHEYAVTPNGPVAAIASPSLLPDRRLEKSAEPVERITDETELFRLVLQEILKVDKVKQAIEKKQPYITSALSRRLNDVNKDLSLGIFPNTPLRDRIMEGLVRHLGTLDVKVIPATTNGNIPLGQQEAKFPKESDIFPSIDDISACKKVVFEEILKRPSRDYPLNSLTHRVRTWVRRAGKLRSMAVHIVSALKDTLEKDHKFNIFTQADRPLGADDDLDGQKPSAIPQGSFLPAEEEDEFQDDGDFHDASDDYDDSGEYEDVDFEAMGIDPSEPTKAKPGSEEKVLLLAARYAAGLPLWNPDDCKDHGPRGVRYVED